MSSIDWIIVVAFLLTSLGINLYYKNQSSKSLDDFFLGGRNLPWYIAGISMVATTFAADTPLWVTEKVRQFGISGNWIWWNMVISGVLTTFFFARLWRRANILTELEFIEIRYSGFAANLLRGFKSIYLGLIMNAVIISWVNIAMIKLLIIFFGLDFNQALVAVAILMVFISIYSMLGGLKGVAITDTLQFTLAMGGCILLAYFMVSSEQIGGISGLKEHFKGEEWRLDFFPKFGSGNAGSSAYSIPILAFFSFIGFQWWASWYPGAEPGGGGYVAQRMMSAKDEKNAVWATLFFQLSHYALRPWPWILVGLCCLVVYPELNIEESGNGFIMAMKDFLPNGFLGLTIAAFIGAYMSTISTQLNWGASFLTNDFYNFYFKKETDKTSDVLIARISTFVIMIFSLGLGFFIQDSSIDKIVNVLIGAGAGLGLVLILRWYWWRINAWSELSATIAPIFLFALSKYKLEPYFGDSFTEANGSLVFTAISTTIIWLVVTFATSPTKLEKLKSFYTRVKPLGRWNFIKNSNDDFKIETKNSSLIYPFISWISATIFIYATLFFIGKIIFQEYSQAVIWIIVGLISFVILFYSMKKDEKNIFD